MHVFLQRLCDAFGAGAEVCDVSVMRLAEVLQCKDHEVRTVLSGLHVHKMIAERPIVQHHSVVRLVLPSAADVDRR